jgi:hypothetical protein
MTARHRSMILALVQTPEQISLLSQWFGKTLSTRLLSEASL